MHCFMFYCLLAVDKPPYACVNGQHREAASGGQAQSGGTGNSGHGRAAAGL